MNLSPITLEGRHIRLEPLALSHAEALAAATGGEAALYQWTTVPGDRASAERYINAALAGFHSGTVLAFANVQRSDGAVIGSTRFFDIETWPWPEEHPRHARGLPDVCEIGYTWLAPEAIRTAANTEAKYLMLEHAFETWGLLRVCLHTDLRNIRSQKAIERIGGRREGILRAHRLSADAKPRDSARYSILASEWPGVKARLMQLLHQT